MFLDTDPAAFALRVLAAYGLPADPLQPAAGWSNQVWLAPAHVVRLSSGRFRDAYAHEVAVLALLPDAVPHAKAIASGRIGPREWMIVQRIDGLPLTLAWLGMSELQRRTAARSLGAALRALHAIRVPDGFDNPWLKDAYGPGGRLRDAYHAPPDLAGSLLAAASQVPGVDLGVLDEVRAFIAERLTAFGQERAVLVHGDVHVANLLWDGSQLAALLDFEGARLAPPDLELDTLLRCIRDPRPYGGADTPGGLTPKELAGVPGWVADTYPQLFSHPRLTERLEVYEALWQLVQLLHFPPGRGPLNPWEALCALLTSNNNWARW
ncbi:MAG: phosphotransferase family protein [Chloroflexota bacterium]